MRYKIFFSKVIIIGSLVILGCTYFLNVSHAASLGHLKLNVSLSYDIYFGSNDDSVVAIKDVNLLEMTEIDGKSFLVIESDGFKLKNVEGYVRLDSIVAILPHNKIGVQELDGIKL